jgi:hypothetical protein
MATPGQLVQTMAAVLGISPATVAQYDRVLSEHGLRSKGGRGRSAAKVSSRDAANLLIAVLASPVSGLSMKDAVRACKVYASLPSLRKASWPENFTQFELPTLAELPKNHSLGDALSELIDAAANGEQFKIPPQYLFKFQAPGPNGEASLVGGAYFQVAFDGPRPWAQILAEVTSKNARNASNMARLVYFDEANRGKRRGDLIHRATIHFKTIRALGALMKDS